MTSWISFTIFGLFSAAAYSVMASGLVLTYATTRVFNLAHGAFGMVLSFLFWDLSVRQGLPVWLSLLLVLGVVAPATGWFVQRFVARGLGEAPVGVSLVVTVGLLVGCIGLATQVWKPAARVVPPFFDGHGVTVGRTFVTAHQLITILVAAAVALALYVLLSRTRIGAAMRASVDNPELLRLFGGAPDTVAALSWGLGIALAGLGGILLVSVVGLDYYALTLLVINAYAAAMVGRLKSLPLTFAGAVALGLIGSYATGYLPTSGAWNDVRNVIPPLFLFAVVVALPQAQLRVGQVKGIVSARVPSMRRALFFSVLLLGFVWQLGGSLSESRLLLAGTAATYAMVMLSLVLLTGYGGHVSLAQLSFAGIGALAYAKVDAPNLGGLLLAAAVAGVVGAVVAIPVLRLTGLYLALATLAFGVLMDKLVFQAHFAFGYNDTLSAKRLSLLGHDIESTSSYVLAMAVFFVVMGLFVLVLRRGTLGRLLVAMRDSPAACGTLGLDLRWFRVGLFGLSAAIAGLAGALFAGLRGTVGAADFQYFNSLPLLLLAVVFGVTTVTGAALGGVALMLMPVLQSEHPSLAGLVFAVVGFGAVALGRDPNGLANLLFVTGRRLSSLVLPRLPVIRRRTPVHHVLDDDVVQQTLEDSREREVPAHAAP